MQRTSIVMLSREEPPNAAEENSLVHRFITFSFVGRVFGQQHPEAPIQEAYASTSSGIRIHYLQSGESTSAHALVLIPGS